MPEFPDIRVYREALERHDPGGIDVLALDETEFRERLVLENHTLKRALTDPHLFSGIGNGDEGIPAGSPIQQATSDKAFPVNLAV